MKVHRKKVVVLATVAALIVNTMVGAFTAMGLTEDELTAAGYVKPADLNIHLADNEYYKEIYGFETTDWVKHVYTSPDATVAAETEKMNSGTGAVKVVHGQQAGAAGVAISVINIQSNLNIAEADKADYIQFYAENVSDTDIELDKLSLNGAGADNTQNTEITASSAEFLDLNKANASWSAAETKNASVKLDGNNYQAIVIKANSKGLYRIPVTAWGSPSSVTRVMLWSYGAKDSTVYFDDIGLVAATEKTGEEGGDEEGGDIITEVPEGYTDEPGAHIHLADNEFYKELSGFETLNTDWNVHPWTAGSVTSSADHKNGGSAGVASTHNAVIAGADGLGQDTVRNVFQVPLSGDKTDFTKAKYLQIYVENPSDSDIELAKIALETNGLQGQLQGRVVGTEALGAMFYDLNSASPSWQAAEVAWSSARIDNTNESDNEHKNRFVAVIIPAGAKGLVRIPLEAWGGAGNLSNVKRVQIWTFIKYGEAAPATLYVDDLGIVGMLGEAPSLATDALNAALDEAAKKAEDDYTEESWLAFSEAYETAKQMPEATQAEVDAKTEALKAAIALLEKKPIDPSDISGWTDKPEQNVYLNPGEEYKYLAGGEDNDVNTIDLEHAYAKNQISLVNDIKNSGDFGIKILQTTGDSQSGFHTLFTHICTEQQDWTDAKYLTFWVLNDQANPKGVLELFYFKVKTLDGTEADLIDYDMTGIKFFDQRTGKWSDLEVMPNNQHRLSDTPNPDGTYNMVPSLQIPANAKGFVRIPLTLLDEEALKSVARLQIFMATSGAPGTYYMDDIGLVTYEGDTAPDYVDGEGDGTAIPDDGTGTDNDYNTDYPVFDWDWDYDEDSTDTGLDGIGQTGESSVVTAIALLFAVSGCSAGAVIYKKRRQQ